MCDKHYKDVRLSSGGLLQDVIQAFRYILSSEVSQEGVHQAIQNKSYQKREERLESALDATRASTETYNAANVRSGSRCGLMGSRVRIIPRSGASSNVLNRVSSLTILGCRETPPTPLDFFFSTLLEKCYISVEKKGLFTHIVT
jgi:hypothetical protein